MKTRTQACFWLLLALAASADYLGATTILWGPQNFAITSSGPRVFEAQVPIEVRDNCANRAVFLVSVSNGTGSSGSLVTAGSVMVNGITVAVLDAFTTSLRSVELPFTPLQSNAVRVELTSGKTGSAVTVSILKVSETELTEIAFPLTSKSTTTTRSVSADPTQSHLLVIEGGRSGTTKPTSLSVRLNGAEVANVTQIQKFSIVRKTVTLGASNTLEVTGKAGTAGATVYVSVRREVPATECDPFLDLALLLPEDGTTVSEPLLSIEGYLIGPSDTQLTVDGVEVGFDNLLHAGTKTDPSPWKTHLWLDQGQATIVATAVVPGPTPPISRQVTVTYQPVAPAIGLTASPASGSPPLEVSYSVTDALVDDVALVELDLDGDGTFESEMPSLPASLSATFSAPGTFTPAVRITRSEGVTATASTNVRVEAFALTDATIRARWEQFTTRLAAADIEGALALFDTDDTRAKYRDALTMIASDLQALAAEVGQINAVSIDGDLATYLAVRTIDGEQRGFWISFLRGADGVWRIAQF